MSCCKNMASAEGQIARAKARQGAYTLLGFCQKAGRLVSGGDAVAKALLTGQVKILLIADDLAENSRKKLKITLGQLSKRAANELVIWQFGTKESLSIAAGRPARGIWAVCDGNFADGLDKKLELLRDGGEAKRLDVNLLNKPE